MKSAKLILAVGLSFGGLACVSAAPSTVSSSAYEQAVVSYLEAAEEELMAIGKQVNDLVPERAVDRPAPQPSAKVITLIKQWDLLLQRWASLSKAAPAGFDPAKQAYEQQRAVVRVALSEARS